MERRRDRRYLPGRLFPLLASIHVEGEPRSAKIIDLSPGGAGLQVSGPAYHEGTEAKLHLLLEDMWMEFPCRIAHVTLLRAGCRFGITAKFENFAAQKAYLQLLQPVVLGSSLRPIPPEEVLQNDPDMHKLLFTGTPGTELNVWRQGDIMGELHGFLWRIDDYLVRGDTVEGVLQITSRKPPGRPTKANPAGLPGKLSKEISDEIRLLFRWTVLNLPKEVPGDIRSFVQGFAD